MPDEIAFIEDGCPITVAQAHKAEYVTSNYAMVLCCLCGDNGNTLYFNSAGEIVCYECIAVEDGE